MAVVILALGATRRRATVAETEAVLAAGVTPLVVVDSLRPWAGDPLPAGVRAVEVASLLREHPALRVEHAILYGLPRRALRLAGRGRLAPKAKKAMAAYERKFANRVHNRVVMPLHRRLWPMARARSVKRAAGSRINLVLATDPASFSLAAELAAPAVTASPAAPSVAFSIGAVPALPHPNPRTAVKIADRNAGI
jgi:hypothetical protein